MNEEGGRKEGENIDKVVLVLGKEGDPVVWLRGLFVPYSRGFFIWAAGRTYGERFGEARVQLGGVGTSIGIGRLGSGKQCWSN